MTDSLTDAETLRLTIAMLERFRDGRIEASNSSHELLLGPKAQLIEEARLFSLAVEILQREQPYAATFTQETALETSAVQSSDAAANTLPGARAEQARDIQTPTDPFTQAVREGRLTHDEVERSVDEFTKAHPTIVGFWRDLETDQTSGLLVDAIVWMLNWHNSLTNLRQGLYEGRGFAPERIANVIDEVCRKAWPP